MKTTRPRGRAQLALLRKSTRQCALHHHGALRVEWTNAGVSIEAVRIRDGGIQKERMSLTDEELGALSPLLSERKRKTRRTA